jgi:K+-sensing histidine kinase KdpD
MGLGVFLTRNVIHGLGGELRFEQAVEGGTICRVTLPVG